MMFTGTIIVSAIIRIALTIKINRNERALRQQNIWKKKRAGAAEAALDYVYILT